MNLKWNKTLFAELILLVFALTFGPAEAYANSAGGGRGSGRAVRATDNDDGTVTMANGLVSIVIVKKTGRLNAVSYTHKNDGQAQTSQILQGRGQYYYGGFMLGNGVYDYSLAVDPAGNGGAYADAKLLSTTEDKGVMEIQFAMLRRFAGILFHRDYDPSVPGRPV